MRGAQSELSKDYEICNNLQDLFREVFMLRILVIVFLQTHF